MKTSNIYLKENVEIAEGTTINNISIGNDVKISKNCILFGSEKNLLEIGDNTYFAVGCLVNGYKQKIKIGKNVSIGPNVTILSDSGPNRSEKLKKIFPVIEGDIIIGDDCWLGMNCMIMPGIKLGNCCIIAAGSFVNQSFPDFSVVAGSPAKLVRSIKKELESI